MKTDIISLDYYCFDAIKFHKQWTLKLLEIIEKLVKINKICEAAVVARLLDSAYYGGGALMFIVTVTHGLCVKSETTYTVDDIIEAIRKAKEQVIKH